MPGPVAIDAIRPSRTRTEPTTTSSGRTSVALARTSSSVIRLLPPGGTPPGRARARRDGLPTIRDLLHSAAGRLRRFRGGVAWLGYRPGRARADLRPARRRDGPAGALRVSRHAEAAVQTCPWGNVRRARRRGRAGDGPTRHGAGGGADALAAGAFSRVRARGRRRGSFASRGEAGPRSRRVPGDALPAGAGPQARERPLSGGGRKSRPVGLPLRYGGIPVSHDADRSARRVDPERCGVAPRARPRTNPAAAVRRLQRDARRGGRGRVLPRDPSLCALGVERGAGGGDALGEGSAVVQADDIVSRDGKLLRPRATFGDIFGGFAPPARQPHRENLGTRSEREDPHPGEEPSRLVQNPAREVHDDVVARVEIGTDAGRNAVAEPVRLP